MPDWANLAVQFRHFQLLFVAVKAGIPAILAQESCTLEQIADALGRPAPRLLRLLRGLVWCGAVETDIDGAFRLTNAGRMLRDDGPGALAAGIRWQGEFFFRAWGHLWDYLETGETPFRLAHGGSSLFDLLEADAELATLFGAPMTVRSGEHSARIAAHPTLAALDAAAYQTDGSWTVADVGGGEGKLVADILLAYPKAQGVLLELPVLESAAMTHFVSAGLSNRCRFVPGTMFETLPAGAEVYILKWVLHDWNDADAARILQRCAEAMAVPTGRGQAARLLIVERLVPEVITSTNVGIVQADLNMLCQMGGAERTRAEYERLIGESGLRLVSVTPIDEVWGFVAMECAVAS